jgi:hypothetical protein
MEGPHLGIRYYNLAQMGQSADTRLHQTFLAYQMAIHHI